MTQFPTRLESEEAQAFDHWMFMRAARAIWPARNPFRQRVVVSASAGAYTDVKFGPIDHGRLYFIQRFAAEDETTAPATDIRIGVEVTGYLHWLVEQNSPAAATLYWDDQGTFLAEGQSLVARFTGPTLADRLVLYLEGWWEEPRSPRGPVK